MAIHFERKKASDDGSSFPYQRMSYDIIQQTPVSIGDICAALQEFSNRSNGEFSFCVTNDDGEIIYGADFSKMWKFWKKETFKIS